jgi:ABC-type thiamine transport system substrate-binding protein
LAVARDEVSAGILLSGGSKSETAREIWLNYGGCLTDGDEQSVVSYTTDRVLQVVNDDRREDGFPGTLFAADRESLAGTLQEACQVRPNPKASQFLSIMSQM